MIVIDMETLWSKQLADDSKFFYKKLWGLGGIDIFNFQSECPKVCFERNRLLKECFNWLVALGCG